MIPSNKTFYIIQYTILVGAVLLLVLLTAINKNAPLFDEVLFLGNMELYQRVGLSNEFLTQMYDQAPGPLYQIVHTFFKPLTGLKTPGVRLVNVFMFIGTIGCLGLFLKFAKLSIIDNYKLAALNLIAVPVVWQSAGMALTEVPAMFFSTLFLCFLWFSLYSDYSKPIKLVFILVAGLSLGMAIIGSTPYLVLIPALVVFLIDFEKIKIKLTTTTLTPLFIIGIIASAICIPMFLAWEGMVPPAQRLVSEGSVKIWHGVLAFAYAGLVTLFINPQWFRISKSILGYSLFSYIILFVLNVVWFDVSYGPLSSFVSKVLPDNLFNYYLKSVAPILMVFSAYFIFNLIDKLKDNLNNQLYLYVVLCLCLLLFSCVGVKHLFSSRYVAQASVFLIIIISDKDKINFFNFLRTIIALLIGVISLDTYINA